LPVGNAHQLVEHVGRLGVHGVGGTEFPPQVEAGFVEVHSDDRRAAGHTGGHDPSQSDGTGAGDRDGRSRRWAELVENGARAGVGPATQRREHDAIYSGTSAFRGIVPVENLPSLPDPQAIQFWTGPDAHLLHYAIGGHGEAVNFFAVVESPRIWLHESTVAC
jgi:hypothetical protein